MFCEKCGAQLEEGSAFCPNCGNRVGAANSGAPVNTGYYAPVGGYGAPAGAYGAAAPVKKKNNSIALIIGAVALVAILAVAGLLIFHKPYMKPIKTFYKGYNARSAQMIYEVTSPDVYEYWDLDSTFYEALPGETKCRVLDRKHLKRDDLIGYASMYGATDAYTVVMKNKLKFYYEDDYEDFFVGTFLVCKVNGTWRICEAY